MTIAANLGACPTATHLLERFQKVHRRTPQVFGAPGRVNLIGEHTDYNDGFVMPSAIGFYVWVAISPRTDEKLTIYSEQFGERVEFPLSEISGPPRRHWSDYVRGVTAVMRSAGHNLRGADLMIAGEVPLGAGLSSSAAIEVSTVFALASISDTQVTPLEIVHLCQSAEHEYAGTLCGIMDQFISVFGAAGHALMLDCRSLDYTLLPLPETVRVVICNTSVKHELATGEYNRRRADCQAAVTTLSRYAPNISALRDVNVDTLERYSSHVSDVVYRRARHVVTENDRVLLASAALKSGDLDQFGELMYGSHSSLRDDYEVSCPELDVLVDAASQIEGVYGARMTGGGFGGCTVNLVRLEAVEEFSATVARIYEEKTGKRCPIYVCTAAEGAGPVVLQK